MKNSDNKFILKQTIKRIQHMEEILDDILYAINTYPESIVNNPLIQKKILDLTDYYDNGQWLQDYDSDSRGELPPDLKRGVLSEDTVYNLLCDIHILKQDIMTKNTQNGGAFMMQNIQAVIFDLDGSLVDSMWMWKEIDVEYLGSFGISLPPDLQEAIEGMSFKEVAEYFKQRFQIKDTIEEMQAQWNRMAWEKYSHEVHLKPGAREFLEECRNRDIKLGIASSNSRELIRTCLEGNQVLEYFSCILSGSDGLKGKPAPDIYLEAAKTLKVDPVNCLVFEDIIPGILAGKNAGMKVCAVEDAYSKHQEDAKKEAADYFIKDYYRIFNTIIF